MKTFYKIAGGVNVGTLLNTALISTIQVDEVRAVIIVYSGGTRVDLSFSSVEERDNEMELLEKHIDIGEPVDTSMYRYMCDACGFKRKSHTLFHEPQACPECAKQRGDPRELRFLGRR